MTHRQAVRRISKCLKEMKASPMVICDYVESIVLAYLIANYKSKKGYDPRDD